MHKGKVVEVKGLGDRGGLWGPALAVSASVRHAGIKRHMFAVNRVQRKIVRSVEQR